MCSGLRLALRCAGLVTVIVLGLTACGQPPASAPAGGTSPATSTQTPSASSHAPAPSEAAQLAAFFAAAQRADGRLHQAAAQVNGDIGATSMQFTPATLATVRALGNAPAAQAIPAGLPAALLRDVLVVYGDLASRTAAFGGVKVYGSSGIALPLGGPQANAVLRGLANGAPAAARFGGDLAAARALAQQTPPLAVAAADSQAAAELALRLTSIDHHNDCDETFGGWAPTELEPVVWQPSSGQHPGLYEGTIGGIRFQATYTAHVWDIVIYAC